MKEVLEQLGPVAYLLPAIGIAFIVLAKILEGFAPRIRVEPKPLLTRVERETLGYLEAAVPQCRVYAQVSMGALIRPKRGLSRRESWSVRGRYSQKIVDFVLEHRLTGEVLALVELDDRSHDPERDRRRDAITAAAGYMTIRLPASVRPSMVGVHNRVTAALTARLTPPAGQAAPGVSNLHGRRRNR